MHFIVCQLQKYSHVRSIKLVSAFENRKIKAVLNIFTVGDNYLIVHVRSINVVERYMSLIKSPMNKNVSSSLKKNSSWVHPLSSILNVELCCIDWGFLDFGETESVTLFITGTCSNSSPRKDWKIRFFLDNIFYQKVLWPLVHKSFFNWHYYKWHYVSLPT